MTPRKAMARRAGLWYLGFTLGPFYLLYVPSQTVVSNDAVATAARVLDHETLYRWGMLAETLGAVIFIGLSLALYRLFEDVDRHRARQLVALVLVSSALGLVTVVFSAAALLVFRGGGAFAGFDVQTRNAVGMLLIRMRGQAYNTNQAFWGIVVAAIWRAGSPVALPAALARRSASCSWSPWVVVGMVSLITPEYSNALFRISSSQHFSPSLPPCFGCWLQAQEESIVAPSVG